MWEILCKKRKQQRKAKAFNLNQKFHADLYVSICVSEYVYMPVCVPVGMGACVCMYFCGYACVCSYVCMWLYVLMHLFFMCGMYM